MRRELQVDESRSATRRARRALSSLAKVIAVLSFLAVVALWSGVRPVRACMIPVFRYALEYWPAEPYAVIVFHRGELTRSDQDNLGVLRNEDSPVDVLVTDVSKEMAEDVRAIYEATQAHAHALPRMVVCYPGYLSVEAIVSSGGFDSAAVKPLLQSPARAEIARRIGKGDAVVWVLLECGEREKDDAAAKLLESEAREMGKALRLPEELLEEPEEEEAAAEKELRVSFSVLRVSGKDPAEAMFVRMLVKSEPDLTKPEHAKEPMAFPVFGRGRALCGLVGKGINQGNIWGIGQFLIGPCSCQVKAASPGTQLLISVDWDAFVTREEAAEEEVILPGALAADMGEEDEKPAPPGAAEAEPVVGPGAIVRNVVIICVLGLALVAAGTLVLKRLKR